MAKPFSIDNLPGRIGDDQLEPGSAWYVVPLVAALIWHGMYLIAKRYKT
jgi:hypothetical protein